MEIVLVTKNGNEPERRRKLDLRDKNDPTAVLARPEWLNLVTNKDRFNAALVSYLTVQQDMLWTNLFADPDGKIVLIDFDNCLRRPFLFTATKPIFFPGGPLSYEVSSEKEMLESAKPLLETLSRVPVAAIVKQWELTDGEALIIQEKSRRVGELGLSQAIASDPDYMNLYFDAPPWWGKLDRSEREKLEQETGWRYNDYYDGDSVALPI